ncbi:hypothetical protein [Marinobacterium sediminicola]|uniref:Uncharacterized protein n=1 Tax=Marinobacterium sediminicola TaxID=518898 RepID=A0ABY1S1T1_9GAMM|nr:hypothetical protein [Marinobacterium sediminicola]ULG69381.1 hypothetical protein LN244_00800 [Marinobacterium sediminicola]SMR75528.1 hypothetical protein SAMN04487964_11065 [Marinobacterium sediminicola]
MMNTRTLSVAILSLSLVLSGCGTIMHPERKGQVSGRIDPGVAVLDGIGLLFFFVPGVIAFAVDFSNGTIYLPGGRSADAGSPDSSRQISFEGHPDRDELERLLKSQAGIEVELDRALVLTPDQYLALHGSTGQQGKAPASLIL